MDKHTMTYLLNCLISVIISVRGIFFSVISLISFPIRFILERVTPVETTINASNTPIIRSRI